MNQKQNSWQKPFLVRRTRFSLKGNKRLRAIGSVSSVLFTVLLLATIVPVYYEPTNTEALTGTATESVLTFSSINPAASVNLTVNSPNGTFATSTDGTNNTTDQRASFSIATNNYTGYTVSISSTNASGELDHGTDAIDTIPSTVTATEFANNSKSGTDLNNTWGYIPNYYNSIANTTNYYPSSTIAATLNSTSVPNSVTGTTNPDTYTIGLGIRADYATKSGTYKNSTIIVSYIANTIAYSITYDANDEAEGATVSNMPTPNPQVGDTDLTSTILSSATPTRNGYEFKGWCSVSTDDETCSGTTYQPGATYGIDQTADNENSILYAMWKSPCNKHATTITTNTTKSSTDAICMQDMNDTVMSTMTTGTQYQLMDIRDNKNYYIAKMADGKVWMTQNLDLDLVTDNSIIYNHKNTDLGWTTNDSTATWVPSTATVNTVDGYSNSNYNPRSYDPGDIYYYTSGSSATDTTYNDLASCTGENESIHTVADCTHYHAGNYYNWSAAVATNDTNTAAYNTQYYNAPNSICPAGWRLPYGLESSNNSYSEVNALWLAQNIASNYTTYSWSVAYTSDGFINIRKDPLYLVRAGYKNGTSNPSDQGNWGDFWSSSRGSIDAVASYFYSSNLGPGSRKDRGHGLSVRCVARISNPGTLTISYDGNNNDGGAAMTDQVVEGGRYAVLNANTYTRTGYSLYRWNTQADGSGTDYTDKQLYDYIQPDGNDTTLDLYAKWAMNQTIIFDADAADATCSGSNCADATTMNTQTINGGSSALLLDNGYRRPYCVFAGWTTSPYGSSASYSHYSNHVSYSVPITNDEPVKTLYAKWNPRITFTAGPNIEAMIVVSNTGKRVPNYIASGGSKSEYASPGTKYYVTVIPATNNKLGSWTRDTNAGTLAMGGDQSDELLLTTTYTVGNAPETLTANGVSGVYTDMQNLASCPANGTNVTDTRDGKSYTVKKLGSYCYMLSNLRLDGGTTITPTNSHVSVNYTLPANTDSIANGWVDDYCKPYMAVENYEYYYNWPAATARSNDVSSTSGGCSNDLTNSVGDICPLGWQLLYYNNNNIHPSNLWNGGLNPGVLYSSGYFSSGARNDVGISGYWAYSNRGNDSTTRDLYFSGNHANGAQVFLYSNSKSMGYSIRCMSNETRQTISFNANASDATCTGTTCSDTTTMNTQIINGGTSEPLFANSYSRTGYAFVGWTTNPDGSGTAYNDIASYAVAESGVQSNITLYAKWLPAITFTAGSNIDAIIVTNNTGTRTPNYISTGSSKTLPVSTGSTLIVTVVPTANNKLGSWTRDTNAGTLAMGGDQSDELLLTTTYTVGNTGETLTANGVSGVYTDMQNLASCPVNGTNVTDTRDKKSYTIKKLGNYCHMLSNLRLDAGITLTSADSDIKAGGVSYPDPNDSSVTIVATTFETPTESWTSSSQDYYCKAIMKATNNEYYYNWYAATANPYECLNPTSDTNATAANDGYTLGSICPAGWTLPTYSDIVPAAIWNDGANPGALSASGNFLSGSQSYVGSRGYWWLSNRYINSSAYYLYFSGSTPYNNSNRSYKYYGTPVRCIRSGL